MKIASSKLTTQGQISVPAEVRRLLGVGPGSLIEWERQGNAIVVRRAGSISSEDIHRALFAQTPASHSQQELEEGVRRYVRSRHARP